MKIIVRLMEAKDLEQVRDIDVLSFSMPWPKDSFATEMNNPVSLCLVAEELDNYPHEKHQIVGVLIAWLIVDEGQIATIAVHPTWRQQRIGYRLLDIALQFCWEHGMESVFLEVRESNTAAQALYHSFGFEVYDRRPKYYHHPVEDALIMILKKPKSNSLL